MAVFHGTPAARERRLYTVMRDLMRTLGWLIFLGGAVSAGAADGTLPSRPVLPRDLGVAPPTRIPNVETVTPLPQGTPVTTAAIPKTVRRAVVADAAQHFNVAESAVVLVRAEQVTWSDGSLGCAEPGRMYTQNLVPGYLVVAKSAVGELAYHTDIHGLQARSCGPGRAVPAQKLSDKTPIRGTQPATDR
jgi:hypothetical protein